LSRKTNLLIIAAILPIRHDRCHSPVTGAAAIAPRRGAEADDEFGEGFGGVVHASFSFGFAFLISGVSGLGRLLSANETLDGGVEGDVLELDGGIIGHNVDGELAELCRDGVALVVGSELDCVQGAEGGEAMEELHERVLLNVSARSWQGAGDAYHCAEAKAASEFLQVFRSLTQEHGSLDIEVPFHA
jgi:hypothetical protein